MSYALTLTNHGTAAIAAALVSGVRVVFATVALADTPAEMLTPGISVLPGEKWREAPLAVDASDAGDVHIKIIVPPNVGGWYARAVGIYDLDGVLLAYAPFPASYKPAVISDDTAAQWSLDFVLTIGSDNKPAIFAPTLSAQIIEFLLGEWLVVSTDNGIVPVVFADFLRTYEIILSNGAIDVLTVTASDMAQRREIKIVIDNSAGATGVGLSFPSNWVFLGELPSEIAAGAIGMLGVLCRDDANVVAGWVVSQEGG